MMNIADVSTQVARRWPGKVEARPDSTGSSCELSCASKTLPAVCDWLFNAAGYSFAGLIVEEGASQWELRHVFYGGPDMGWVHVVVHSPLDDRTFPSIVAAVHPADWHEREAEDHFGLIFAGHPRLGDFVLHDDRWQEGLEPMRRGFNGHEAVQERQPNLNWRPRPIVSAPGSFMMPIGPVFAGMSEPVHFLLETVGEDVIHTILATLLQVSRHREDRRRANRRRCAVVGGAILRDLGLCPWTGVLPGGREDRPPRCSAAGAKLRVLLAELERFRHHVAAIEAICESTALAVAASQTAMLLEDLLRLSGTLTGHRYLFGHAVRGRPDPRYRRCRLQGRLARGPKRRV